MHRNVLFTFGLIVYFFVGVYAVLAFNIGLFTATILILGLPTFLLARFSAAPRVMLATVGFFGLGIALLLEALGYIYDLWAYSGSSGIDALGGLSLAVLFLLAFKMVFLVLFYELLFDDGEYSIAKAQDRFVEFGFFAIGTVILVCVFYMLMNRLGEPSAYYWISIILLLGSFGMLTLRKVINVRLVNKITYFVAVAAVPMLSLEVLLQMGGYKSFTTSVETVSFAGVTLPLGEVLLAFIVPAFVATVYELYLDDRQ